MFKSAEDRVSIYGLKTKFGGGRSSGFALIYDSLDAKKKYDSVKALRRVSTSSQRVTLAVRRSPRQVLFSASSFVSFQSNLLNY